VTARKRVFRSFEEARAFVRTLGLKNQQEWEAYSRSGDKPADIPSTPERVYQAVYQGIADWIGMMPRW